MKEEKECLECGNSIDETKEKRPVYQDEDQKEIESNYHYCCWRWLEY